MNKLACIVPKFKTKTSNRTIDSRYEIKIEFQKNKQNIRSKYRNEIKYQSTKSKYEIEKSNQDIKSELIVF